MPLFDGQTKAFYFARCRRRLVRVNKLLSKVESGHYKISDNDARVFTKRNFFEVVESGKSDYDACLIICNRKGETVVMTKEFSQILFNALKADN